MSRARLPAAVALAGAFCAWWFVVPAWIGFLTTVALAKGLAILGVALLLRAGLVSFGQGLFFCSGAYAAGFAIKEWGVHDALALIGLGLAAGIGVALLTGLLVARYRELFFAMLTLAFSMMLYGILVKEYATTGGSQGMTVSPVTLLGHGLGGGRAQYFFTLACVALVVLLAHRFVHSPLGQLARALRDNEIRAGYLGASVQRTVLATFVVAGGMAGLGGALEGISVGHVDPTLSYWTQSGEFVFVALLAGTGSVVAPFVGSVAFEIGRSYALTWFPDQWQIVLGVVLLGFVLFLPGGLWSAWEAAATRTRSFARRRLQPQPAVGDGG